MPVLILLAALLLLPVCRYTVRDIGFVDLAAAGYQLQLPAPSATSDREQGLGGGELQNTSDPDRTWWNSSLRNSNVRLAAARPVGPGESSGPGDSVGPGEPGRPDQPGRPGEPEAKWYLTAQHREGRLLLHQGSGDDAAQHRRAAARALHSPLRDHLTEVALDRFAFVLLMTSGVAAADQELHAMAARSRANLERLSGQLPRPVLLPVEVMELTPAMRAQEDVLLWSLGLEDLGAAETAAVVLYGKGRRAGPVLRGAGLRETEMLSQLALVGESCECETDRRWADEPRIPLDWPQVQRQRAQEMLGFQPDSPMVQAEVLRILAKRPQASGAGADSIESLVFGYGEYGLIGDGVEAIAGNTAHVAEVGRTSAPGSEVGAEGASATETATPYRAVQAGEGDWDFADASATEPATPDRQAISAGRDWRWLYALVPVLSVLAGAVVWFRRRPS